MNHNNTTEMIEIRVLFFASLKEKAGIKETSITIDVGSTIKNLKDQIQLLFPALAPYLPVCLTSINRQFSFDDDQIPNNAEVAFFPPVSGGQDKPESILMVTDQVISLDMVVQELTRVSTGAVCIFTGVVRGHTERENLRTTNFLEYESYIPMAEMMLRQIEKEIRERWPKVEGIAMIQRIGRLSPGTPTVMIACFGAHRDEGVFEASRYGIDRLKEIVPVWKKEIGPDNQVWIEGDYIPKREDRI